MISNAIKIFAALATVLFGSAVFADEQRISNAAESFVRNGVTVVLESCTPLSKAKPCSHGKFIKRIKRTGTSSSGDRITSQEFFYDGMEVVYRDNEVVKLYVTKPNWPMMLDLRVGTQSAKVRQALGTPTRSEADSNYELVSYCINEDCAEFCIDLPSGRVTAVSWLFYYD